MYKIVINGVESKVAALKALVMIPGVTENQAMSVLTSLPATLKDDVSEKEADFILALLKEAGCQADAIQQSDSVGAGTPVVNIPDGVSLSGEKTNPDSKAELPGVLEYLVLACGILSLFAAEGGLGVEVLSWVIEAIIWFFVLRFLKHSGRLAPGIKEVTITYLVLGAISLFFDDESIISDVLLCLLLIDLIVWIVLAYRNKMWDMLWVPISFFVLMILYVVIPEDILGHSIRIKSVRTTISGLIDIIPIAALGVMISSYQEE